MLVMVYELHVFIWLFINLCTNICHLTLMLLFFTWHSYTLSTYIYIYIFICQIYQALTYYHITYLVGRVIIFYCILYVLIFIFNHYYEHVHHIRSDALCLCLWNVSLNFNFLDTHYLCLWNVSFCYLYMNETFTTI